MATRTQTSGISGRSKTNDIDNAKFSRIRTTTTEELEFTGSLSGTSGFIVESAGSSVITPTEGNAVAASVFTAKTLYEIGVSKVSGSGTVHVIF
tara:strand:+ start:95 stop:376 length:282 start_codon:yes stop_codon:yes gene_type:complete